MFQGGMSVFLIMIDNITTKITELCLVEITEKHYLQWFEGGT